MIKTDKKTLKNYRQKSSPKDISVGDNDGKKYGEEILPAVPLPDIPQQKEER